MNREFSLHIRLIDVIRLCHDRVCVDLVPKVWCHSSDINNSINNKRDTEKENDKTLLLHNQKNNDDIIYWCWNH